MASKNLTHAAIHTGLSQVQDGEQWADMLNFRSGAGRTTVVPRRLKLLEVDGGFHTVARGANGVNYVFGDKKSFTFRGHEATEFKPLWKVDVKRETTSEDQSENIKVRGSFLGSAPTSIKVTVVAGKLILDKDWPVEPEVVEVVKEPIVVTMPVNNAVHLQITYPKGAEAWTTGVSQYNRKDIVKKLNPAYVEGVTSPDLQYFYYVCLKTTVYQPLYQMGAELAHSVDFQFLSLYWRQITLWDDNGLGGGGRATGTKGEWAVREGSLYRCLRDCSLTNTNDWFPGRINGWRKKRWQFLMVVDVVKADVPVFAPSKQYVPNDLVIYQGAVYRSKTTHFGNDFSSPTLLESENWLPRLLANHVAANGAKVRIHKGTQFISEERASAYGQVMLKLPKGSYTVYSEMPDFTQKVTAIEVTDVSQFINITIP